MYKPVIGLLIGINILSNTVNGVTTSLIIPCYYKHAPHLYALLKAYEQQTVLPDEVVISLSEIDKVAPDIVDALQKGPWAFPVKLIGSTQKKYAGANRNTACDQAKKDILILQDADDYPHPRRVEIIKYCFARHAIKHLMHEFFYVPKASEPVFKQFGDLKSIPFVKNKKFMAAYRAGDVTNGNIAVARSVYQKIKWPNTPRGQDMEFNVKVYKKYRPKTMVILAPLIIYRTYLSSTQPG